MERIHLAPARDKLLAVVNCCVPENVGNSLTRRGTTSLYERTLLHGSSVPEVGDTMSSVGWPVGSRWP
jgi:hypothetical protein